MKTYVYVDGFNLYYGAVKGTPYRWLDLKALALKILRPGHEIEKVKYFTARVSATSGNPDAPNRQNAYIRALRSLPEVEVIYGHFPTNKARRQRADGRGSIEIIRTEEKGSDVNLATHLVVDAFRREFECAVVVSNDSDLCEPVRIVAKEEKLKVGVLVPMAAPGRKRSGTLCRSATFWKPIRIGPCRDSQLPDVVTVDGQDIHRPVEWR